MFKCGVLKHTLEGLLACLNVEFSSKHSQELGGLLACLNVEFSSSMEGLLACLNVEFSSIHWKVFSLV